MNKVAKIVIAIILLMVIAYGAWLVMNATFPFEAWFEDNPEWRSIFILLVIIGVIGLLAGIVETKRR